VRYTDVGSFCKGEGILKGKLYKPDLVL
jgi:hypothetical protein